MTDDLTARPGDPDLDCCLTGLRIAGLVTSGGGDLVLALCDMDAAGWRTLADGSVTSPSGLGFALSLAVPETDLVPREWQDAILRAWAQSGAYVTLTSARGRLTVLRGADGRTVVLPRSEAEEALAP